MNSVVELDQSFNWKSVTDLYEEMFADDTTQNEMNVTSDTFKDSRVDLSHFDVEGSNITLKNLDYTQEINKEQTISSPLNEQIEQIERRNVIDNATVGNSSRVDLKANDSNMEYIPMPQINDNTTFEIISPPFDISPGELIQGRK